MSIDLSDFKKMFNDETSEPQKEVLPDDDLLVTYCRDCRKLVNFRSHGRKKTCLDCSGKNISLATKRAMRNIYHIDGKKKK